MPTVAGVLLFGKNERVSELVPRSALTIIRICGMGEHAQIVESVELKGNLLTLYESVMKFINRYCDLPKHKPKKSKTQKQAPISSRGSYHLFSAREAVANQHFAGLADLGHELDRCHRINALLVVAYVDAVDREVLAERAAAPEREHEEPRRERAGRSECRRTGWRRTPLAAWPTSTASCSITPPSGIRAALSAGSVRSMAVRGSHRVGPPRPTPEAPMSRLSLATMVTVAALSLSPAPAHAQQAAACDPTPRGGAGPVTPREPESHHDPCREQQRDQQQQPAVRRTEQAFRRGFHPVQAQPEHAHPRADGQPGRRVGQGIGDPVAHHRGRAQEAQRGQCQQPGVDAHRPWLHPSPRPAVPVTLDDRERQQHDPEGEQTGDQQRQQEQRHACG